MFSKMVFCNEELFLQAQKQYEQKNFDKARELFASIPNKGEAVWYNLGNCAYKMQDFQAALVYWNCAEYSATTFKQLRDIWQNKLVLCKKKTLYLGHYLSHI